MARVLVSAGHTMMDPGAIFQDLREADLTRKIAPMVVPYLEKAGIEVQSVPLDLPLFQRLEWINNTGYSDTQKDLLIEIHVNDADGSKRGIEAWHEGDGNNNSQNLALAIVDAIDHDTKYEIQGVKSEFDHELGMLTFLNRSNPAAVIVELLYMDNEQDIAILKDDKKLDELAKSVARGILKYIGRGLDGKPTKEKLDFATLKNKYTDQKPTKTQPEPSVAYNEEIDEAEIVSPPPARLTRPTTTPPAIPTPRGRLGGAPSFGGANRPPFPSPGGFGSGAGGTNMMADREKRKEQIEDIYLKALGHKPDQNALNYFLNRGTPKEELIQKIIESQEHADLIKAKKELSDLKGKYESTESKLKRAQAALRDQKALLDNMNRLVAAKTHAIKNLEKMLEQTNGVPSQVFNRIQQAKTDSKPKAATNVKIRRGIFENLFDSLGKRFS